MRVAIHQPNYLPWLGYFYKIQQVDVFILLDDVQYSKNSYQNRVQIKGSNGAQWLTQPVSLKSGAFQKTNELQFADERWKKKHIKTVEANYGRCSYFEKYSTELFDLISSSEKRLSLFNESLISWVNSKLELQTKMFRSSDLQCEGTSTQLLVELVKRVGGTDYLAGKGSQNYQDDELFSAAGIKTHISDFSVQTYPQRWGDFVAGLSIIDLLFNLGPESRAFLQSSQK